MTSPEPPRRRPPSEAERWAVLARRGLGGADSGGTRAYRRVPEASPSFTRTPTPEAGQAILVGRVCPTVPDTNQEVSAPIVEYGDGSLFEQAVTGSFRVWSPGSTFYVRMYQITPGYQIRYAQLVVFNDANYHYLESGDDQPVEAYQINFGPIPSGGWLTNVGTSITDDPGAPGYVVQMADEGAYHYRITLGIESI